MAHIAQILENAKLDICLVLPATCPHTSSMLDTLLPLILLLLAFYLWQAALKAREGARALGHELCARAQVQLLDQTVALQRLGLARGADGRLQLRRRYRFELSTDGLDRHHGSLDMLDGRLQGYSLPLPEHAPAVAGSNVISFQHPSLPKPTQH